MAKHKSVRLEKQQLDAISEMVDVGIADNESEALRSALTVGLTEFGVLHNGSIDTALRQIARRFGEAFAGTAIILLGITMLYPVEIRLFAVAPAIMSLACFGFDRLLKHYEPGISRRLGLLEVESA